MIFSIDEVWKLIEEKEGQSLKTFSGLEFTYKKKATRYLSPEKTNPSHTPVSKKHWKKWRNLMG